MFHSFKKQNKGEVGILKGLDLKKKLLYIDWNPPAVLKIFPI
jgi:hypothetical protein